MAHHPIAARSHAGNPAPTRRARSAGLGIALALLLAGCTIGDAADPTRPGAVTVSPAPPVPPSIGPSAALLPSAGASSQPPTAVPGDAVLEPPRALLGGLADPPDPGAAGALGSWTWGESGDDAPWLVPSAEATATAGGELVVAFDPDVVASTWTARWARLRGGVAGDPVATATGAGPVVLAAPGGGAWSLQVDARFGRGQQAAWYWRLEVVP